MMYPARVPREGFLREEQIEALQKTEMGALEGQQTTGKGTTAAGWETTWQVCENGKVAWPQGEWVWGRGQVLR
jgi:hypothetical protein